MSALERMADLEDGWATWDIFVRFEVASWRPRLSFLGLQWKDATLAHIEDLAGGWTLQHLYKKATRQMARAIRQVTPEMAWFRNAPVEAIQPGGRENMIPLTITWGQHG